MTNSKQSTLLNVLSVTESIEDNYTSNQLLTVLDDTLFNAVSAIMRNTDWMNIVLANVINWYSENTRRKISSTLTKPEVFESLITVIISDDVDFKLERLRRMQLERSLWFKACRIFVELCPDEPTRFHDFQFSKRREGSLHVAKRDASFWLKHAVLMKTRIMEKYMRKVGKQALYAKKKNPDINLDDSIQNLTVSLSQAIDKCSSDRGTLTTYIDQWFMSAQTKSRAEEYGTAYTIPDTVRKEFFKGRPPNIYVSIHDIMESGREDLVAGVAVDPSKELEGDNLRLHLLRLAKHADPLGYARFSLGLEEILS